MATGNVRVECQTFEAFTNPGCLQVDIRKDLSLKQRWDSVAHYERTHPCGGTWIARNGIAACVRNRGIESSLGTNKYRISAVVLESIAKDDPVYHAKNLIDYTTHKTLLLLYSRIAYPHGRVVSLCSLCPEFRQFRI